jgi:hypothetical protein
MDAQSCTTGKTKERRKDTV